MTPEDAASFPVRSDPHGGQKTQYQTILNMETFANADPVGLVALILFGFFAVMLTLHGGR